MDILAVDNREAALQELTGAIREAAPDAVVRGCGGEEALAQAREGGCRTAFIAVRGDGEEAVGLARELAGQDPRLNLVFVADGPGCCAQALRLRASGYIYAPPTPEAVREELKNLRYPDDRSKFRVRVQTFGNFEIFVDGRAVPFTRSKSKELLAYLVDRMGASATIAEIAAILWEDKRFDRSLGSQTRTVIMYLMQTLRQAQAQDIIVRRWNSIAVDVDRFDCDYYNFLRGSPDAVALFSGEYMSNYSWAEYTAGFLQERGLRAGPRRAEHAL